MRSLLLPVIVGVLAAALGIGVWLGGGPDTVDVAPTPLPPTATPDDPAITFEDLLRRARPDADGAVDLSVTASELTSAANNELPADAPVEEVRLELRPEPEERPTVDFSTALRGSDLEVTGSVALDLVDGRVEPALVDARAGPLPIPGSLREPLDDVIRDAGRFFAELAQQGVEVTRLEVTDAGLQISGQVTDGPPRTAPAATASDGASGS